MNNHPYQPGILSRDFHFRFFPQLLWSRLHPSDKIAERVTFSSNMGFTILFFVCIVLALLGIPSALKQGSLPGWILSVIGLGGISFIFISSVLAYRGSRPTYDQFLLGIFFFFVFLGMTVGIFIGTLEHSSALGLMSCAAGLVCGYFLGIMAGLWFQYLGWIAGLANMMAGPLIIGMVTLDLVLLLG
jgi:hypothetical protein